MTHPRYLDALTALAAVALVLSNVLAAKLVRVVGLTVNGATLLYPAVFWLADVITEVYGFRAARRVIWIGFAAQLLALGAIALTLHLPAAIPQQAAPLDQALRLSPWIVAGSLAGYWCGDFANAIVLSRLKLLTRRRRLWSRTIGSTVIGQAVDTVLFVGIAFGLGGHVTGQPLPLAVLWALCWGVYLLKVAVEVLLTPAVYALVGAFKRAEGLDPLDRGMDYSPFAVEA